MSDNVRPPACPGRFYPAEREQLRQQVRGYIDGADLSMDVEPRAVIAPHAGYVFSGPVAGHAFAGLTEVVDRYERVVLVGPSHFVDVSGLAAPSHEAFRTPLGEVSVDRETVESLEDEGVLTESDHAHRREHSLETHVPFLQELFDDMPLIVPIVTGRDAADDVQALLDRTWDDKTLVSVSSDLSHYLDYGTARQVDDETRQSIEAMEADALDQSRACGHVAISGVLETAQDRPLDVETLAMANSGDTAGDRDEVVGYGAWALGS